MRKQIFGFASLLAAFSICVVPFAFAQEQNKPAQAPAETPGATTQTPAAAPDKTTQPSTEVKTKPKKASAKGTRKTRQTSTKVAAVHRYRGPRYYHGYPRYEYCPTCERAVNYSGCGYYNCYPPREHECYGTDCWLGLQVDEDADLTDEVLLKPFPYPCYDCEPY